MRFICLSFCLLYASLSAAVADLPAAARPFPDLKLETGTAFRLGTSVIIQLDKLPANRKLNLPRMANVVKQTRWLGQTGSASMKLHSEIEVWTVDLSDPPAGAKQLLLELVMDSEPTTFPGKIVATADKEGVIALPAKFATTHGEKLRFEPQPHKNTVGYWVVEKDFAEWHLSLDKPGTYDIEIFQGCGKGQGGSNVEIRIADQKARLTVLDTGHFQNFQWRSMGQISIPAGDDVKLELVAVKKQANAVMDCREIRLIPTENTDPSLRHVKTAK